MEHIDKLHGTFERRIADTQKPTVPTAVIKRLPRYHRYLGDLLADGRLRISSAELSKIMNVTASQIRQDLNCFGGFGQQGYGYNIKYLYGKISELLGVTQGFTAVIVGAGNLGKALAATRMFGRRGVTRLALFDVDEKIIGTEIYGIPVHSVDSLYDFCRSEKVDIGVLTVPKDAAYSVAKTLIYAGVKGIWNFANTELSFEDECVTVENIHLGDSLMTLCYEIKSKNDKENAEDSDESAEVEQ
ncbi:MAG: redox-sensing transcriptional repressor Rex [Clostridia bacterium]|nr:redox-sensing transcriptional repressor Rex [Clostridia bacterium]